MLPESINLVTSLEHPGQKQDPITRIRIEEQALVVTEFLAGAIAILQPTSLGRLQLVQMVPATLWDPTAPSMRWTIQELSSGVAS